MPVTDRDLTVTNLMDCVFGPHCEGHGHVDSVHLLEVSNSSVESTPTNTVYPLSIITLHIMKKSLKVKVNMLNNQALNAKSTPHCERHCINKRPFKVTSQNQKNIF